MYVEGCALQDEAHPAQSGFNVIELELPGRKQRITHFEWSKDHYTAITDQDWTALVENSVFRHGFRVNDEFARFLNDPGAGYTHSHKREVKLRDIFVYPDLTVRGALPKGQPNEILAESFESFLRDSSCIVFEGEAQSGRTSLAKIAYLDLSNSLGLVPVFIDGRELKSATEQAVINRVTKAVSDQYSPKATERFNQLDSAKRVLIVDDWHRSPLNSQGREELLALVGKRFGKIFLFSDPMFDVKEFATMGKDQASLLRFQHASLRQFGHKSRGRLIEKWLMLGREHSYDEEKLAREILEIENVITTLMGKNTLPKFPFIVHHRSFGVWHQR